MKSRAFVCDPVCALPYGHNVVGLKYFSDAISQFFGDTISLASKVLPHNVSITYGFEREFEFYYRKHIIIDDQDDHMDLLIRQYPGQDKMLEVALNDMFNIINKYQVSSNDSIVFPCVDYYGAMGLLVAMRKIGIENAPSAYLRFIGVMENATTFGSSGLVTLGAELVKAINDGFRIRLCAETPVYSDYLAEILQMPVSVVPYPVQGGFDLSHMFPNLNEKTKPMYDERYRIFNVASPGSARLDKGYLDLFQIFSNVRRHDPKQTIKFTTQTLPVSEAINYTKYTNQLYAIPGVKLLPSSVSEDEINLLYKHTSLVILPYDSVTYKNRGSAVFMECLSRGIPVIALEGSAFCTQINYYGAGAVVSSIDELVDHIFIYRDTPLKTIYNKMLQARHRYSVDSNSAILNWIVQ